LCPGPVLRDGDLAYWALCLLNPPLLPACYLDLHSLQISGLLAGRHAGQEECSPHARGSSVSEPPSPPARGRRRFARPASAGAARRPAAPARRGFGHLVGLVLAHPGTVRPGAGVRSSTRSGPVRLLLACVPGRSP